jgi:hypothetical protein
MPTAELETSRTKRSREDEVTYMKWRQGVLIFYTCVGLAAVGIGVAAHFARVALLYAGN